MGVPDAALPRLPVTGLLERRAHDDSPFAATSDMSAIATARDDSTPPPEIPAAILSDFRGRTGREPATSSV
jgi:hypothetical protein